MEQESALPTPSRTNMSLKRHDGLLQTTWINKSVWPGMQKHRSLLSLWHPVPCFPAFPTSISLPQFPTSTGRPEDKQAANHLPALIRKIRKIYSVV